MLGITERILRDEETDEDPQLIFAPGSSLGGARPKAPVIDQYGQLAIAKFPKETDGGIQGTKRFSAMLNIALKTAPAVFPSPAILCLE